VTDRVRYLVAAREDIARAHRWYDNQQPGLGRRFRAYVKRTVATIAEHPGSYGRFRADVRRAVVPVFPFGVFYYIDSDEQLIVILAVMDLRRDPDTIDETISSRR
jgi:hypothetical protein